MSQFEFEIPLRPVPKGRPQFNRKTGIAFTPGKTRRAEQDVRFFLGEVWKREPLSGPINLAVGFSFLRPKSVSQTKRPYMTTKPDLDNLVKLIKDAANGLLWADDSQIIEIAAFKVYGPKESIRIQFSEVQI